MVKIKKALLIIAADGFRDEEYKEPREALEAAGIEVKVAASKVGACRGMFGTQATAELTLEQVNVGDYDIVVFVGGIGASEYFQNKTAHKIAQEALSKDKVLAAICIAPTTLANAGILRGRRATAFSSQAPALRAAGAEYTGKPVEVDGKIITGSGPEAAKQFGEALLKALK